MEKLTDKAVEGLEAIHVIGKNLLRFLLRNGRTEEREWAWESRANSWTPEMRQKASEQMKRRWQHE